MSLTRSANTLAKPRRVAVDLHAHAGRTALAGPLIELAADGTFVFPVFAWSVGGIDA